MHLHTYPDSLTDDQKFHDDIPENNYCYSAISMNVLPCDGENPFLPTKPPIERRLNSKYIIMKATVLC